MAVKRRLTVFARLIITLAITAGVFFGIKWLLENTELKEIIENAAQQNQVPTQELSGKSHSEE
jgi:hypothetical protein